MNHGRLEYLLIIDIISKRKQILEQLISLSFELYHKNIISIES